jgi:hypothetical protein
LYPGESASYTWQEPTRPKKLSVKVGHCDWMFEGSNTAEAKERKHYICSFNFIKNEEQGHFGSTQTIRLEEIGHIDSLPVPIANRSDEQYAKSIHCIVDTEGTTSKFARSDNRLCCCKRIPSHHNIYVVKGALIISDELKGSYDDDEILIKRHLTNIRKEISSEHIRHKQLDALSNILTSQANAKTGSVNNSPTTHGCDVDLCSAHNLNLIESELRDLVDFVEGQYIVKRHQLLVQVCI